MSKTHSPHRLPLRFRLAWTLLWLVVLGALALFGRDPAAPAPRRTLPQLREAWIHNEGGGAATVIDERIRHEADGGARDAAFRQP